MPPRPPKFVPPIGFLLSILAMWLLDRRAPIEHWIPRPWNFFGLVPLLGGIAIAATAVKLFRKRGTNLRPLTPSQVLVVDGPFRFTRNPMYLGMVLTLIGVAILFGSVSPFIVVLIFMMWIRLRFIRREEQFMTEQFGDDYVAYTKRVRRWL